MSGTNGVHPDATGLPGGFKVESWKKLTEFCLTEARKRLAQAEEALGVAQGAVDARRGEVELLERALALRPSRRRRGVVGGGVGRAAATYLLEVMTTRLAQSGEAGFTTHLAMLSSRGWPRTTVESGLRRLVADGLIERVALGRYELTDAGRAAPPAGPGRLPLLPPRAAEEVRG